MPVPCRALLFLFPLALLGATSGPAADTKGRPDTLEGTKALTMTGDIASELVDGVDRFLLREIEAAASRREKFFRRDYASQERYDRSLEPNRKRLAHILGLRDPRVTFRAPELVGDLDTPSLVG